MAMLKAGVIGCGGRGQSQARGYHTSPDVELVACADPVEACTRGVRGEIQRPEDIFGLQTDVRERETGYCKCHDLDDFT